MVLWFVLNQSLVSDFMTKAVRVGKLNSNNVLYQCPVCKAVLIHEDVFQASVYCSNCNEYYKFYSPKPLDQEEIPEYEQRLDKFFSSFGESSPIVRDWGSIKLNLDTLRRVMDMIKTKV